MGSSRRRAKRATSISSLRCARRSAARAARGVRTGRSGRRKLSGLQARRRRRVAAAQDSKAGRGHRGFVVTGDPDMSIVEAARRRDFSVNAISWDPLTDEYFDPFDGRADIERRVLRMVDAGRSPTTACACCARCSSPRASSSRWTRRPRRCAARSGSTICPPSACGRDREAAAAGATAVDRICARDGSRSRREAVPELQALAGCVQEPEWHPEGDVWVHTLQVIDQARTRIDDLARPAQIAVMLGAVTHDLGKPATTAFIDGRIRSMDHEEQGVQPATAFLDRLNVHTIDGYDVRKQCSASRRSTSSRGRGTRCAMKSATARSAGSRTKWISSCSRASRSRIAKAAKPGTFDCSAMNWFLERARALGVEHRPPGPILLGRHLSSSG